MAITPTSASSKPHKNKKTNKKTKQQLNPSSSSSSTPKKRTKSPGLRVVGSRIYDSQNGKTCHQCRQKTMDFSVSCTYLGNNNDKNKKKQQCTSNFCHSCLSNRYGEKAEEAAALGDWKCPKCRGICNCSFCMKKRGCGPTGILIHTAKANGFSSVSNMLNVKGSTISARTVTPKKRSASDQETQVETKRKARKQTEADDKSADTKNTNEDDIGDHRVEVQLPKGTELTRLGDVDVPSADIGHALQLLEFCEAFGEVLDLKKGQPEILLRELTCGNARRRHDPLIVQFHIRLISLIAEDSEQKYSGKSWLEDFRKCISESRYPSKGWLLDSLNLQSNGYEELDFSKKLRLLNFLCDEALGTTKLRSWIDEKNSKEKKKAKENLIAKRKKDKNMKKKMQDEVAKAILLRNGVPLTISEHKDLVLKIKAETAQTLANSLESKGEKQESYVVRSEPIALDAEGRKLWKLRALSDKIGVLLQDSCYGDMINFDEKWFGYNVQDQALVGNYISTLRNIQEGQGGV